MGEDAEVGLVPAASTQTHLNEHLVADVQNDEIAVVKSALVIANGVHFYFYIVEYFGIMEGFKINSMKMKNAETQEKLWQCEDWDHN